MVNALDWYDYVMDAHYFVFTMNDMELYTWASENYLTH